MGHSQGLYLFEGDCWSCDEEAEDRALIIQHHPDHQELYIYMYRNQPMKIYKCDPNKAIKDGRGMDRIWMKTLKNR